MPKTALFDPITMRGVELQNRVVVAPMCQYSADDGVPSDWHLVNVGQYATSGTGLIFVEKTAVEAIGRITPGCTGIWNDAQAESWARVTSFARNWGSGAKMGMQLGHERQQSGLLALDLGEHERRTFSGFARGGRRPRQRGRYGSLRLGSGRGAAGDP